MRSRDVGNLDLDKQNVVGAAVGGIVFGVTFILYTLVPVGLLFLLISRC